MNTAKAVRLNKEVHPERYCSDPKCLWNTERSGPCPRHMAGTASDFARGMGIEVQSFIIPD